MEFLFAEMCPRFFNVEALQEHVFGGAAASSSSSIVMAVVEREKSVQELSEVVGKLEIKSRNDVEKYKKKLSSSNTMMFGGVGEQKSLVQEYGPYIFAFPIGGA